MYQPQIEQGWQKKLSGKHFLTCSTCDRFLYSTLSFFDSASIFRISFNETKWYHHYVISWHSMKLKLTLRLANWQIKLIVKRLSFVILTTLLSKFLALCVLLARPTVTYLIWWFSEGCCEGLLEEPVISKDFWLQSAWIILKLIVFLISSRVMKFIRK